jgi:phage virion morphogenesis protein
MLKNGLLRIEVSADVRMKIGDVIEKLQDGRTLFKEIAGALEAESDHNFEAQGRPHWAPLDAATIAARLKRNKGGTVLKILQDHNVLAESLSSDYGPDFAQVGTNVRYAGIHQFGGTINYAGGPRRIRLRTDAKGNLLRQGTDGSAKGRAQFAREKGSQPHKRYRESLVQVDAYQVEIPARPFLPFKAADSGASLQPEAEQTVSDILTKFLGQAFG